MNPKKNDTVYPTFFIKKITDNVEQMCFKVNDYDPCRN
jgi:hypothetical protein